MHTTLSLFWSSMRYYNEGLESTTKQAMESMEKLNCWKHLHDNSSLFLSANKLQQIFQSYVRQICVGL